MAKNIKYFPQKKVVVKSSVYSRHVRAARGSREPAAINDVLKPWCQELGEEQLWQVI